MFISVKNEWSELHLFSNGHGIERNVIYHCGMLDN